MKNLWTLMLLLLIRLIFSLYAYIYSTTTRLVNCLEHRLNDDCFQSCKPKNYDYVLMQFGFVL